MNINDFDPNGIGVNNGAFVGLPFSEDEARVVVMSIPWDVTVSSADGTSRAPKGILQASLQLDLYDPEIEDAWKLGLHVRPPESAVLAVNNALRSKSEAYIKSLELQNDAANSEEMQNVLDEINKACTELHEDIYRESVKIIAKGKMPAVLGGDHSSPFGLLRALSEANGKLGVLHLDAHMDLRKSYEGFKYSHASVFYNALSEGLIEQLVQVGIRDNCQEEVQFAEQNSVEVYYDKEIREYNYKGVSWHEQCERIIENLPNHVYVSYDIDVLSPHLCPNTGTPVPGGLEFNEAQYLIKSLVRSGRKIIGFDLCEVGGDAEWDANVGARILYNLSNWAGKSQGWI